jgi:hypothetical protein
LWVFFALVLAFYVWIVQTSTPYKFNEYYSGPYGQLADALLHGQLSLRNPPPPGLLALPNPYDPIANAPFRAQDLHDLTLWHDKLYIYWGPVPGLLLFLPLRLAGVWLPQNLATVVFAFGGLVFSVLVLRFLVRRFLPATPTWAVWLGMISLALCNVVPFSLRRAGQYELAIDGALCFGFLGLWLLLTGWFGPKPSVRRLAGASLAIGLAVGCRPTAALYMLIPLVLVFGAWRSGRWPVPGHRGRRPATTVVAALAGPLAACTAVLLAYNMARFGSLLEFGQRYQLSSYDQTHRALGHLSYLGPGLFYYLLLPPRPLATFPFLDLGPPPLYPWSVPADYTAVEMTAGVLPMIPLMAALALLPFVGRRWDPGLRQVAGSMVAAGALTILLLAFMLWGTTQRYEVDFVSLLLIPALLVWYTVLVRVGRRWPRRMAAAAGSGAVLWGSVAGLAESFKGYTDGFATNEPKQYRTFVDAFSPLSRLLASAKGGPVVSRVDATSKVDADAGASWGALGPGSVGFTLSAKPVTLTIVSPDRRHSLLRLTAYGSRDGVSSVQKRLLVGFEGSAPLAKTIGGPGSYDADLALAPGINRVVLSTRGPGFIRVDGLTLVAPPAPTTP